MLSAVRRMMDGFFFNISYEAAHRFSGFIGWDRFIVLLGKCGWVLPLFFFQHLADSKQLVRSFLVILFTLISSDYLCANTTSFSNNIPAEDEHKITYLSLGDMSALAKKIITGEKFSGDVGSVNNGVELFNLVSRSEQVSVIVINLGCLAKFPVTVSEIAEFIHDVTRKQKKMIILDASETDMPYAHPAAKMYSVRSLLEQTFGLGIDAELLAVHFDSSESRTVYKTLHTKITDESYQPLNRPVDFTAALLYIQSVTAKQNHDTFAPQKKFSTFHLRPKNGNQLYREFELRLSESNLACTMMSHPDGEPYDYCKGNASIDLKVLIGIMRADISDQNVENFFESMGGVDDEESLIELSPGKYLRISISTDTGTGAGFHLANRVEEEDYESHGSALRKVRLGPFAQQYNFWVSPEKGRQPIIFRSKPENMSAFYYRVEKSVLKVRTGLEISNFSGSRNAPSEEIGRDYVYKNKKQLEWDNDEYTIRNASRGAQFDIYWDRDLDICQELFHFNTSCYYTSALWDIYPVFDIRKFSPMSHSNFTPNIDAIYQVPLDSSEKTEFNIGASVVSKVIFGEVVPAALFLLSKPVGEDTGFVSVSRNFSIDWGHPILSLRHPIRIQSLMHDSRCITANSVGEVLLADCGLASINPLYIDPDNRIYHPTNGTCLTAEYDKKSLTFRQCDLLSGQEWDISDGFIISEQKNSNNILQFFTAGNNALRLVPLNTDMNYAHRWRVDFL